MRPASFAIATGFAAGIFPKLLEFARASSSLRPRRAETYQDGERCSELRGFELLR